MPEPREEEALDAAEEDRRFSQEDDDLAGRSWHGMNSDIPADEVGRFIEDVDVEEEPEEPAGRTERV